MTAQYDRVSQVSALENVRIGILPLGRPVSALPWCDVNIYDDLAEGEPTIVDIELPHGELWLTESTDVAVYLDLVRRLWESAVVDDAARELLARLSAGPGPLDPS
jgi:hypothetical protein